MSFKTWYSKINILVGKILNLRAIRFIVVGLINTGSTYLLYLGLLIFLDYRVAYSISYVSGIVLAFFLNSKVVFKTRFSLLRMTLYPLIYLFQYIANTFLLYLFVNRLGIPKQLSPLLIISITLPIVFILNKVILTSWMTGKDAVKLVETEKNDVILLINKEVEKR